MGRLTVRLPNALHSQLEKIARSEGVSLNQYIMYALTRQAAESLHHQKEAALSKAEMVPAAPPNRKNGGADSATPRSELDTPPTSAEPTE